MSALHGCRVRFLVGLLAALSASCSTPYFAQYPPLPATGAGERVSRAAFSLVVPTGWQLRGVDDPKSLDAFEPPPLNGQYRLFRSLVVEPAAAFVADDADAMAQAALAALRQRHEREDLEVYETGRAELAGRDCWFLRGRIRGGAATWYFEVLDYFVPGESQSLIVGFSIPDGQMAASRDGFAATAATLQTTISPPRDSRGELAWLDDDRIAIRLPDTWQPQADAEGGIAVYLLEPSGARCDVTTATATADAGFDLDRLARGYHGDQSPKWPDLQILAVTRMERSGRAFLRFTATYRDQGETVIVDDTYAVLGNRLDRVLFRVPHGDYGRERAAIDRAVDSLRWR